MKDIDSAEPMAPLSEKEERELERSVESTPSVDLLPRADLNTRLMTPKVRKQVLEWVPQGPSAAGVPETYGPLEKLDVIPGILAVPTLDEDGDKMQFAKKLAFRVLRALPLIDDAAPWPSLDTAATIVETQFVPILPPPAVEWSDVTSDRSLSLFAFQGLGAHRLEPVDADSEGAAYKIDLTWMHAFAVRPGLEPYGACAYFAADRSPLRIYTSHDDRAHRPGDASWEDAKWRWRSALFAGVTIADHLGATHYLASNLLVTVTREHLPAHHPLRRFLKPFGFGAVAINLDAGLMLSPEGGLAHRLFSFTYGGLSRCLLRGIETTRFETFPDAIAAKRVAELGDAYPYATDGLALYDVLRTYVRDYFEIFFPGETAVADPAIRAWWQAIIAYAPTLGLGPLNETRQLTDLITQILFTVTGFHSQVGTVAQYLVDPQFLTCKIRAGARICDIQTTVQVLNLAALTAFEQPPLIGDYTHLFLEHERDRAVAAFDRYQKALVKLSEAIDERNRQRQEPFQTLNPRYLDTSVST